MKRNYLRTGASLALFLSWAVWTRAEGITDQTISPDVPTTVVLSQNNLTTILFPSQFVGVFGDGLVLVTKESKGKIKGLIQGFSAVGDHVLTLKALAPDVNRSMTVFMDGKLYVFNLITGSRPDIAITLKTGAVTTPERKVTDKMVVDSRVKYAPELMRDLMKRAKGALLMRTANPEGYKGYEHKNTSFISDDTRIQTKVTDVHKFPVDDAIVLEGEIHNQTAYPLYCDVISVAIGTLKRQAQFSFVKTNPIPPNGYSPVIAELLGDLDGSRANMSIDNEYRVIVDKEPRK